MPRLIELSSSATRRFEVQDWTAFDLTLVQALKVPHFAVSSKVLPMYQVLINL